MYSKILDQETLSRVIAAAPVVRQHVRDLARLVVDALKRYYVEPSSSGTAFQVLVSTLAEDVELSPKQVGLVLRELGLQTLRTRVGYVVVWNLAQLAILDEALWNLTPPSPSPERRGEDATVSADGGAR